MRMTLGRFKLAAVLCTAPLSVIAAGSRAAVVNSTGLPTYPNLTNAFMDPVLRTDSLGRWCAHFSADTPDSIESVENWYRRIWAAASETDLAHDPDYGVYPNLNGIKLAIGVNSVAVYKVSARGTTAINLTRCGAGGTGDVTFHP